MKTQQQYQAEHQAALTETMRNHEAAEDNAAFMHTHYPTPDTAQRLRDAATAHAEATGHAEDFAYSVRMNTAPIFGSATLTPEPMSADDFAPFGGEYDKYDGEDNTNAEDAAVFCNQFPGHQMAVLRVHDEAGLPTPQSQLERSEWWAEGDSPSVVKRGYAVEANGVFRLTEEGRTALAKYDELSARPLTSRPLLSTDEMWDALGPLDDDD